MPPKSIKTRGRGSRVGIEAERALIVANPNPVEMRTDQSKRNHKLLLVHQDQTTILEITQKC